MKIKIVLVICLVIILASCIFEKQEQGTVIASVNNETLSLEEIRNSFADGVWDRMTKDEQRRIVNQWIDLTLLATYSRQNNTIKNDLGLKFVAKNAEKKIFSNALIANELNNIKISDEDLFNYYRMRQAEFMEQVREFRVQRIFMRNEADIRNVKQMLDRRQIQFTPAAQQYSEEGIGRNGGYMNSFVNSSGPDSTIWRALHDKDRYYEAVLKYRDGWLIARYYDDRMATANTSFYDVKDQIERTLKNERRADVYDQLLKEARLSSTVIIGF
jgi:hypothetical protein